MSITATYKLEIDWNNDGDFLDADEDCSSNWMSAVITRGFNNPLARMPGIGRAGFVLDNRDKTYSPLAQATRRPRRAVRFTMSYGGSDVVLFDGYVESIQPTFGQYHERQAIIECVDAVALLDLYEGEVALLTGVRANAIINSVVNAVYTPVSTSYDRGINLFPTSGDRWRGQSTMIDSYFSGLAETVRASNKIQDACVADWGHFFIAKDGQPTFYNRHRIRLDDITDLTLDDTMVDLSYIMEVGSVYNHVEITCHPRTVGTENEVLGCISQQDAPRIGASSSHMFNIRFRDSVNTARQIGGKDCITPVAGTDFNCTDDPGGEGTNVNSDITPSLTSYGDHAEATLANGGGNPCYVQELQVRGKAVRVREEVTMVAEDGTSQSAYQKRKLSVNAVLMSDEWRAQMLADWLLDYYKDPQHDVRGVTFVANRNATLMAAARDLELLDRVEVSETQTALSAHAGYIYQLRHDIPNKHNHRVTFNLLERKPLGLGAGVNAFTIGTSTLGVPSTDVLIY